MWTFSWEDSFIFLDLKRKALQLKSLWEFWKTLLRKTCWRICLSAKMGLVCACLQDSTLPSPTFGRSSLDVVPLALWSYDVQHCETARSSRDRNLLLKFKKSSFWGLDVLVTALPKFSELRLEAMPAAAPWAVHSVPVKEMEVKAGTPRRMAKTSPSWKQNEQTDWSLSWGLTGHIQGCSTSSTHWGLWGWVKSAHGWKHSNVFTMEKNSKVRIFEWRARELVQDLDPGCKGCGVRKMQLKVCGSRFERRGERCWYSSFKKIWIFKNYIHSFWK